jgi:hypothetical protein
VSVFGPNPIHPLSSHAALAAQQLVRPTERQAPVGEATKRMKDAHEQRVAGTESEDAVRRTADEHAESEQESRDKGGRRDGQRDGFVPSAPPAAATPQTPPKALHGRLDLRA